MAELRSNPELAIPKMKGEVAYTAARMCKVCEYFYSSGRCSQVEGNISEYGVCKLWEAIGEKSPYRDKEFFQKEFSKAGGK